ncbi:MAG: alpha/beta hydrolase [Anaerolineales bacterium]
MELEIIDRRAEGAAHETPILFIHGAWHGAWCWDEHFLRYFSRHGYPAHALSLRGHGGSQGRERLRWTSIADYVSDVAQAAGRLARPPVVVGHSMGGHVVQKYLETHPAPGAVLLASVPHYGVLPATVRFALRHPVAFARANLTLSLYPLVATTDLKREAFFPKNMPQAEIEQYAGLIQDESYRAFLDMVILNLPRPRRVTAPVLVIGGDEDGLFRTGEFGATASAYGTTAVIQPGAAHDLMLGSSWQIVADVILAWLNERGI